MKFIVSFKLFCFFYKDSICDAWVNYLASKTVDYVFYDVQNRKVFGALLCTKNASYSDDETFDILNAFSDKTFVKVTLQLLDLY